MGKCEWRGKAQKDLDLSACALLEAWLLPHSSSWLSPYCW